VTPEPWPRTQFIPGGAPAQVFLACFSEAPMPKRMSLEAARHGIPRPGVPREIVVSSLTAEDAPDFFAGLLGGPLRVVAERDLGETFRRLELSRHCHRIQGSIPDPPTLAHLQAAWGIARWFVEQGACAALDGHSLRWTAGDAILRDAPDRPFDLTREVTVVFETDRGIGHTRGLAKFGRPDLVVPGVRCEQFDAAHKLLISAAHSLAMGHRVAPGSTLSIGGSPPLALQAYAPEDELSLNNVGLVVSDADPKTKQPLPGIDRFVAFLK